MTTLETVIRAEGLGHRYGRGPAGTVALDCVDLTVPAGSTVALLGPNGAGKSTLLRILAGLMVPTAGQARVLGANPMRLGSPLRARLGFVADGLELPGWMRLGALEAWLAPLYPRWDPAVADHLRDRFGLDRWRRIRTLSRGERRKAALLCALAPQPELLLLDEPFGGVDLATREELARGLLSVGDAGGWTLVVASHEVSELEHLADRVLLLSDGRFVVDETAERLRERFRQVEVLLPEGVGDVGDDGWVPPGARAVERAGRRRTFLWDCGTETGSVHAIGAPEGSVVETRPLALRELYLALTRRAS